MLRGIEELSVQPLCFPVRAVGSVRHRVPEGIVLCGIGQVILVPDPERVAALQVPEVFLRCVCKNDPVVIRLLQVSAQGIFEDPGFSVLRGSHRHVDHVVLCVIVCLRIPEIPLLSQFSRRCDLPAFHLLKLIRSSSLRYHDFFHILINIGRSMAGVKEIIGVFYFYNRTRACPSVLPAAAAALQDGIVVFSIGHEVLCCRQVNRVVVGIAALFQVIDIPGTVLIIRHRIAHIGLVDAVNGRPEKGSVLIGFLLASRCPQCGKILIILNSGKRFPAFRSCRGSCRRGL